MGEHEPAAHDKMGRRRAVGRAESQDVSHSITEASRRSQTIPVLQKPELESGLRLVLAW